MFEQQKEMSVELAILFVEHNKDLCRFVVLSAQRSRYQWLQDWQQHLIHDVCWSSSLLECLCDFGLLPWGEGFCSVHRRHMKHHLILRRF